MRSPADPRALSRRQFLGATSATVLVGCSGESVSTGGVAPADALTSDAASDLETANDSDAVTDLPDLNELTDVAEPDTAVVPDIAEEPDLVLPDGQTAVAVVGVAGDVEAAVRQAVLLAGGLDAIKAGDTVFIKPNAVHPFAVGIAGVLTSAEVLSAVVRLVKERGAGRIIVGDRAARGFDSQASLVDTGLAEAAESAGADEIYGAKPPKEDPEAWVLVQPPGWESTWDGLGGVLALRKIVEADHFIDLAVCKNHRWAGFSLTMKNLIGAVGDDSRDRMHYVANDVDQLSRDIVTLNGAFSPLLSIIDARTCIVNGGPEGILGDAVTTTPKLIIAGKDRIAVDALGAALIQREQVGAEIPTPDAVQELLRTTKAWQLPQIVRAVEAGFGVQSAKDVVLRFDGVADAEAEALEERFRATG